MRFRATVRLAACVSGLALAGCSGSQPAGGPSATLVPPAAGSAQGVVREYVAAVNRHDEAAAYALMTRDRAAAVRSEVDGLDNVLSITDLVLRTPISEGTAGTAAQEYRQALFVPVTFTLHQRQVVSMQDGPTVWGYLLARNSDTDPWRIADEGPV